MPILADQIDADARKVIRRLVRHQYQAYLVGGCVRDLLLGRKPKDFDIATSATPNEVKELFRNCRIIGRRFRLAHIFFGSKIIETATFRSNPREGEPLGEPGDTGGEDLLIRRDNVFGTAEEDARRRDFTINGLFYDDEADEVIDYVGGLDDLKTRSVRTIGEADIRFREDPVRILRAIKFAARLDFHIEPSAWQAILDHQDDIPKCAAPRVLEEIYRLMRGGAARRSVELLLQTGVMSMLLPELEELLRDRPDSQEARWMWQILARIDASPELVPTNAVLLSALIGPLVGEPLFDDGDGRARVGDVGQLIEERGRPWIERLKVSRRDAERARQILLAQRRIAPSKRRRGRAMALVRRDYFQEALQVYQLVGQVVRPDEESEGELSRWRQMQTEGEGPETGADGQGALVPLEGEGPGEAADDADEELEGEAGNYEASGRRRRRRRGGRGRRASGRVEPGAPTREESPARIAAGRGVSTPPVDPPAVAASGADSVDATSAPAATGTTTPVR